MNFQDFKTGKNFQKLTDYEYARTPGEAVGFFFIHFLILIFIVVTLGMLITAGHSTASSARILGHTLGMLYCTIMAAYLVLRKQMRSWQPWALVVLTFFGSFMNFMIGLGIMAYLTTRPMWWPLGVPPERKLKPAPPPKPAPKPKSALSKPQSQPRPKPYQTVKKSDLPPPQPRLKRERISPDLGSEEKDRQDTPKP